ncbi:hypothetical protein [Fusibacter ferrireducens]|uniref:Uncharacterized protein n=1 Tax=Fusibacter ferrireducens TaxID=2785058 RepID=A0ABR9ZU12_9FIRM|nr:hypothetical protein [Fusibacter ferrireducens]MBF4693935.1 hypothetical protein [Fusibacter ferrireducens]
MGTSEREEISAKLEKVSLKLETKEGYRLAIGGICLAGTQEYWKEKFTELTQVQICRDNIYMIDYTIATALRDLAEASLYFVGCSLDTQGKLNDNERTGGIVGCPNEPIESAASCCEIFPNGFSMYSEPGGPGMVALADPEITMQVVKKIKSIKEKELEQEVLKVIQQSGIDSFILVFDGSGDRAQGMLIVSVSNAMTIISLKENRVWNIEK